MKKFIVLSVFLLGIVLNASAIKVLLAWQETSPNCITYIIIVTEDDGELLGAGSGQVGPGCGQEYIDTDPESPNEMDELMEMYPEIRNEINEAYQEYKRE